MRYGFAALLILTMCDAASAAGRPGGTGSIPECHDDFYKFCASTLSLGSAERTACMNAHRSQLSPQCAAARKSH
jgi:hypothetical protein